MNIQSSYTPGVCNIGPAEIASRKRAGWLSAAIAIFVVIILFVFHAPTLWRLFLFFPITGGAISFLQTYFHFCVAYGIKGIYNVLKPAGQVETVEQASFRQADRTKSLQIVLQSMIFGVFFTLLVTFIL